MVDCTPTSRTSHKTQSGQVEILEQYSVIGSSRCLGVFSRKLAEGVEHRGEVVYGRISLTGLEKNIFHGGRGEEGEEPWLLKVLLP